MINDNELSAIGRIVKPHGINGEVVATIDRDIDPAALRCIVLKIDGINVPFFISSHRVRGSESILLTIDGIGNEHEASEICGLDIHALDRDLVSQDRDSDPDGFYMSELVGYEISDSDGRLIGTVNGYDDSTANILLIVSTTNQETKYVPLAEELITSFDHQARTISIDLPKGILDL